jgi:transposase
MGDRMTGVLTDGQWATLAPLIEACRPHHKTQHHDLRRTIEAIIWRCQNGAAGTAATGRRSTRKRSSSFAR